jgi:hypothetical protein
MFAKLTRAPEFVLTVSFIGVLATISRLHRSSPDPVRRLPA